jgi:hypothetical protein
MNARTHTLPLWIPPKNWVGPVNLEIDEVTTGGSLLTDTSSTTERIAPLNPEINLGNVSTRVKSGAWTRVGRFHHKEPNQLSYA